MNSNDIIDVSFESRVCNLVTSLINYVNSNTIFDIVDKNNKLIIKNDHFFKINNEHEGKTLLHLCAEMGFCSLYSNLINLRNILLLNKSDSISSISMSNLILNELDLMKLDNKANTPIVFIFIF